MAAALQVAEQELGSSMSQLSLTLVFLVLSG